MTANIKTAAKPFLSGPLFWSSAPLAGFLGGMVLAINNNGIQSPVADAELIPSHHMEMAQACVARHLQIRLENVTLIREPARQSSDGAITTKITAHASVNPDVGFTLRATAVEAKRYENTATEYAQPSVTVSAEHYERDGFTITGNIINQELYDPARSIQAYTNTYRNAPQGDVLRSALHAVSIEIHGATPVSDIGRMHLRTARACLLRHS